MSADFNENLNINIYMNEIPIITTPEKTLLSEYLTQTHPVRRKVNGVMTTVQQLLRPLDNNGEYTKHFIKWNKDQIKNYRTTLYIPDPNKVYDFSDGKVYNKNLSKFRAKFKNNRKKYKKDGQVLYKPGGQYDKRKFKQRGRNFIYEDDFGNIPITQNELEAVNTKFKQILRDYRGQDIYIVTGIDNTERKRFRGVVPQQLSGWYNRNKLQNLLMEQEDSEGADNIMFSFNNIQGDLFDGGGGLKPRQQQGFIKIYPVRGFTDKRVFKQSFLDGKINHCVLDPMLEYSREQLQKFTNKKVRRKIGTFTKLVDKIIQYKKDYCEGVPQNKLQEICNETGFNVDVFLPSSLFQNKLWLQFKGNKGMIRYTKQFRFVNSRWNHLDILHETSKTTILTGEYFDEFHKRLIRDKEYFGYQEYHAVDTLYTCAGRFIRASDYADEVKDFIKENNLNFYKMNTKKDQPELTNFIECAVMTNGTVDFRKDLIEKYKYDIGDKIDDFGDEIEGNNLIRVDKKEVKRRAKEDGLKHIDMRKAYTKCDYAPYFDGYLGKIWEFRKTNKIVAVGFYQIRNIKNITPLIEKLGVLYNDNVYFSQELEYYKSLGITFDIICGCWGSTFGIDFGEEKDSEGNTRGMYKKEKQADGDSIAHYCKWFGVGFITSDKSTIKIDTDNKDWIENLWSVQGNKQANIKYFKNGDKYTCCIDTPKNDIYHYKHICGAILSYQRILMIEQLRKFKDINNIVRVCVDGIYYINEEPELIQPFEYKSSVKLGNSALSYYRWNSIEYLYDIKHNFKAPKSKPYSDKIEVHIGPGGCGKTHKALTDEGLNNVCYIAHSWKLCRAKAEEYKVNCYPNQRITKDEKRKDCKSYVTETLERFNVLVVDEVSTMTAETQRKIVQYYGDICKIIFCGDISKNPGKVYQCPAFMEGIGEVQGFTIKPEYQVIEHTKNRRCKDTPSGKQLLELLNLLRDLIDKGHYKFKVDNLIKSFIDKNNLSKVEDFDYKPQDLILNRTHKRCRHFDDKFKHIQKYKILEGEEKSNIVYQKPSGKEYTIEEGFSNKSFVPGGFRIQHGYTIDSIQGETAKERLYIDTHSLTDLRHLYTAMSRAKELNQIHFII